MVSRGCCLKWHLCCSSCCGSAPRFRATVTTRSCVWAGKCSSPSRWCGSSSLVVSCRRRWLTCSIGANVCKILRSRLLRYKPKPESSFTPLKTPVLTLICALHSRRSDVLRSLLYVEQYKNGVFKPDAGGIAQRHGAHRGLLVCAQDHHPVPRRTHADVAALSRSARTAPLPQWRRALHRLQAVRSGVPGAGDHH